jgi:hypothetical protein
MIPKLKKGQDADSMIDDLNDLIDKFNFLNSNLALSQNFNGQIVNVSFAAGETKKIAHKLGKTPKFRIILRQEGNGVISDSPSSWNDYSISLTNNGTGIVTATIFIVRE